MKICFSIDKDKCRNVEHIKNDKTDKWHLSKCHSDLMLRRLLKNSGQIVGRWW
jgi:hypothetical protein